MIDDLGRIADETGAAIYKVSVERGGLGRDRVLYAFGSGAPLAVERAAAALFGQRPERAPAGSQGWAR